MDKEEFRIKFLQDQKEYREKIGFYKVIRRPGGQVFFTNEQLLDISSRYKIGESMTSIGKSYACSRQTISVNLEKMGLK